jgi:hypothetical protein
MFAPPWPYELSDQVTFQASTLIPLNWILKDSHYRTWELAGWKPGSPVWTPPSLPLPPCPPLSPTDSISSQPYWPPKCLFHAPCKFHSQDLTTAFYLHSMVLLDNVHTNIIPFTDLVVMLTVVWGSPFVSIFLSVISTPPGPFHFFFRQGLVI